MWKVRPQASKDRASSERRVFWYTIQFGKADESELAGGIRPSYASPRKLGGAAGCTGGNNGD